MTNSFKIVTCHLDLFSDRVSVEFVEDPPKAFTVKKPRSSSLSVLTKAIASTSRNIRSHTGGTPLRWMPNPEKSKTEKKNGKPVNPLWKMQYEGSEARREQQQKAERVATSGTGYLYKQGRHRKVRITVRLSPETLIYNDCIELEATIGHSIRWKITV